MSRDGDWSVVGLGVGKVSGTLESSEHEVKRRDLNKTDDRGDISVKKKDSEQSINRSYMVGTHLEVLTLVTVVDSRQKDEHRLRWTEINRNESLCKTRTPSFWW